LTTKTQGIRNLPRMILKLFKGQMEHKAFNSIVISKETRLTLSGIQAALALLLVEHNNSR
jgi:hypothetical protein